MRLINITTLELQEFVDQIPRYAILSHTWDKGEISFQDYNWIRNFEQELEEGIIDELAPKQQLRVRAKCADLKTRAGYIKIQNFVNLAHRYRERGEIELVHAYRHGFRLKLKIEPVDYIWVDTCCINKESSAELSEAINSMHEWYIKAEFCVAYLGDVTCPSLEGLTKEEMMAKSGFSSSKWFTRGWTLQELLVPEYVNFYSKDWTYIASKVEILELLKNITGISRGLLIDQYGRRTASVATKMSWAARRKTTRVEDQAYCLLGLFGVNMPLLYGEGKRAFLRLQHEILRTSDDQSILLWGYDQPRENKFGCIFAPSPREFERCGKACASYECFPSLANKPFFLTNVGLHISVMLFRQRNRTYAVLPVKDNRGWLMGIPLATLDSTGRLEDVQDGIAIGRGGYDQPLALFRTSDVQTRDLVLKTLTILHNAPPSQQIVAAPKSQQDEFVLSFYYHDDIELIEHSAPALKVTQQTDIRATVSFHGITQSRAMCYFRARVKRAMGEPNRQIVVKFLLDTTSGELLEDGTWEWDAFRSPSMAPSLAALLEARKDGYPQTEALGIHKKVRKEGFLAKRELDDGTGGKRVFLTLCSDKCKYLATDL